MSQQPTHPEATVTTFVPAPLRPAVETLNRLMQEVRRMPLGGDLEGLIEERLADLERQCLDLALAERQQAADEQASEAPEAFPPSGPPPAPGAVASRPAQAAHDPDAAR